MQPAEVLTAFDAEVRRAAQADWPGTRVEVDDGVVRQVAADGQNWSGVTWSDLYGSDADAVIARQVRYFRDLGQEFEWKLYDYDRPADLADRLLAAGFVPGTEETLMVADVGDVPTKAPLPAGVRLVPVIDEAGVAQVIEVHDRVFGTDHAQLHRALLAQLREAPDRTAIVLAMAGDLPVCAARIDFVLGRDFAGLWGGGTLPGWRGRGIYRALVAYRARLAAARGCRYLQVDALADSQPILARLGFVALARTTPYLWRPPTAT